jgi:LmbE family N-acetylglucosaminyl deacetylase
MRWIYLSPHFDDAVLSCGGLIFEQTRQGISVEIWTIFAGNPPPGTLSAFAQATHFLWGTSDGAETVTLRKAEDQEAASLVGADLLHFDLPDCIYRRSPDGTPLYAESVLVPIHPSDRGLPKHIARVLKSELLPGDTLVCPLTLGGHVDHVLARQAAESLCRHLYYYADIPYLLNNPQTLAPTIATMQDELFGISEEGLRAWLDGVAAYRSQISSLFKGDGTLADAIHSFWESQHGMRLWRVR